MSCSVGHRRSWDLLLLWLWCRLTAVALIQPLAWDLPYATGTALKCKKKKKEKRKKKKKEKKRKQNNQENLRNCLSLEEPTDRDMTTKCNNGILGQQKGH